MFFFSPLLSPSILGSIGMGAHTFCLRGSDEDCGVSVECLEVIEEHDLNDIFNDDRAIGQKILLRHRLREWRKGLHWVSGLPSTVDLRSVVVVLGRLMDYQSVY